MTWITEHLIVSAAATRENPGLKENASCVSILRNVFHKLQDFIIFYHVAFFRILAIFWILVLKSVPTHLTGQLQICESCSG